MKIGFHGVKDYFHNGEHIGALFHFMNTLRKFIDEQNFDKVVVFWDGEDSTSLRGILYPKYKQNRTLTMEDAIFMSYLKQKNRIKQYLEEVYIRQLEISGREADDLIAYYCQVSENEDKLIFSSDRDLTQLISEKVSVYSPSVKATFKHGDKIKFDDFEFPHYNVKTLKILTGDKSDNISGILRLGEKTIVKYFPEMLDSMVTFNHILTKAEELLEQDKKNTTLKNIVSGKTKDGEFGESFYQTNKKIVDLQNPLISDEGRVLVEQYYADTLDPEGRGYKNLIRMMTEDGFFKYLGKSDDEFIKFIRPLMKLTRKEKRQHKQQIEK